MLRREIGLPDTMGIKWSKIRKPTDDEKKSRRICVGNCSVNNRAHFASKAGFLAELAGFASNGSLWYKGYCGGHALNRVKQTEPVVDTKYTTSVEWLPVDIDSTALAEAKIRAEKIAETLRKYSDARKKLTTKAPKKQIQRFDRAVKHRAFSAATALARRYGVYL